jgi:predicted HTH domain antitoxin
MRSHTLALPEEVLRSAKIPKSQWDAVLKRELALQLYREGMLSFANARRLAGMEKLDFHMLLGERQIPRQYDDDVEDYEQDLANLQAWRANR